MRKPHRLKILSLLLVVVLLAVSFHSCADFTSPERVTIRFLDRLSAGNIRSANRLTIDRSPHLDRRAVQLYQPIFDSLRYGVSDVVIEGGVARVYISVQAVDLAWLMADVSSEVTRIILSAGPGRTSNELFYTLLRERLSEPELPTFNFSATVRLIRVGGRWRIDMRGSEGLADAITGGMGMIIGH